MERHVTRSPLHAGTDAQALDLDFWLRQPVQARLAAVETPRQQHINALPDAEPRLQRVVQVVKLRES